MKAKRPTGRRRRMGAYGLMSQPATHRRIDMDITSRQISELRREAEAHGDLKMSAICQVALGADPSEAEPGTALAECTLDRDTAWGRCEDAIEEARAQHDA